MVPSNKLKCLTVGCLCLSVILQCLCTGIQGWFKIYFRHAQGIDVLQDYGLWMIRQCNDVYNLSAVDINTTITLYNTTCNTSSYREIYIANKEGASTDFLYSGIELVLPYSNLQTYQVEAVMSLACSVLASCLVVFFIIDKDHKRNQTKTKAMVIPLTSQVLSVLSGALLLIPAVSFCHQYMVSRRTSANNISILRMDTPFAVYISFFSAGLMFLVAMLLFCIMCTMYTCLYDRRTLRQVEWEELSTTSSATPMSDIPFEAKM